MAPREKRPPTTGTLEQELPRHLVNNIHSIFQVLAGINAYALYKAHTKDNTSRRDFIFKLAEELVRPFIDSRTVVTTEQSLSVGGPRRRYQVRMACKEGKSAHVCQTCSKRVFRSCSGDTLHVASQILTLQCKTNPL